jgi:hypothetical protein
MYQVSPVFNGISRRSSKQFAIEDDDSALVEKCFGFPQPMKRLIVFSTLIDPQAQFCNLLSCEVLWWTHGGIKAIFNYHIENTVPTVPRYNHRPVYGALHKGIVGRHTQTALEVTRAIGRQMTLKAFGL